MFGPPPPPTCHAGVPATAAAADGVYANPQDLNWVVGLSAILGFLFSFGIGANDAANSWGTSVGSGAISVRAACWLGGLLEWLGAVTLGGGVSTTIKKGVADIGRPDCWACGFCDSKMALYMTGMAASLLASAAFMVVCSWASMPVSTTHSIVGAIVGMTVVGTTINCLSWGVSGLGGIVASWVTSPLLSGLIGATLYAATDRWVVSSASPASNALLALPALFGTTAFFAVFMVLSKSATARAAGIGLGFSSLLGLVAGAAVAAAVECFLVPRVREAVKHPEALGVRAGPGSLAALIAAETQSESQPQAQSESESTAAPGIWGRLQRWLGLGVDRGYAPLGATGGVQLAAGGGVDSGRVGGGVGGEEAPETALLPKEGECKAIEGSEGVTIPDGGGGGVAGGGVTRGSDRDGGTAANDGGHENGHGATGGGEAGAGAATQREQAVAVFYYLQLFSACLAAYAHGSNDTSHAAGPFSAVVDLWRHGPQFCANSTTSFWVLCVMGIAIAAGYHAMGYRTMVTMAALAGHGGIDFHRGFCMELATAITVVLASLLGVPVSSTHCQVGAIVFVGLTASGARGMRWGLMGKIGISWLVTVPVSALASAAATAALRPLILRR